MAQKGLLLGKTLRVRKGSTAMKHSEMAAYLRDAAADMQRIAIMDDDWEMPDELVLSYIRAFLTDPSLRKPGVINGKWNPVKRG